MPALFASFFRKSGRRALFACCAWGVAVAASAQQPTPAKVERVSLQQPTFARQASATQESGLIPLPPSENVPAGPTPLSLNDLESLATQRNPTLTQAIARVNALRGKWVQEGLYPNPQLIYKGDEMGNEGRAGFQGAGVSQEIVTKGKRQIGQAMVSQEVRQAQQEFAAQEFRVRNDVRLRFYEVLLAQRGVELWEELERVADTGVKISDSLFRAQEVSKIDVLQARVEFDTVRLQSEKSRQARTGAWRRLAATVGVPDLPVAPLLGDIHTGVQHFEWNEALQRLLGNSPELSAAQARVEAARWGVQKACVDRHPNLNVEVSRLHDNTTSYDVTSVNVGFPVPLFNRNQGNIQTANSELVAAQSDVERVALSLQDRLASVYERYAVSKQQVERYEQQILPTAKESLELVTKGYKAGESNFNSVLISQRTHLQTQVMYLEALKEWRETSVLIEGLLLSDSLGTTGK